MCVLFTWEHLVSSCWQANIAVWRSLAKRGTLRSPPRSSGGTASLRRRRVRATAEDTPRHKKAFHLKKLYVSKKKRGVVQTEQSSNHHLWDAHRAAHAASCRVERAPNHSWQAGGGGGRRAVAVYGATAGDTERSEFVRQQQAIPLFLFSDILELLQRVEGVWVRVGEGSWGSHRVDVWVCAGCALLLCLALQSI